MEESRVSSSRKLEIFPILNMTVNLKLEGGLEKDTRVKEKSPSSSVFITLT